ncbi:hypothetical protein HYH02_003081 [Chlamydomonas schloesseri]|uniref:Uncharacterized protein n=1 Tax=Chlamydomonas schloesseri TaxID=2026947 RepID=A0A836BAC4_9CHLO|nr:hypothetical protein HYH02_003081 [Chlamydomonas schloesseri]|eukprot:KAG2452045.1 hypothetical protein HYH02_003081 [Chlamydomonas schloesseri]
MKAGYELQLQTGDQTLQENLAEKEAFQRLMLEPQVIALASTFTARIISGKARSGSDPSSGGMKAFILKNEENSQLVGKLTKVAGLDCSPDEFAEFADKNYTLRNDDQHNSLDEFLIDKARKLKAAGAVRLLHSQLSWQCSLIANMEELLDCLKEAS